MTFSSSLIGASVLPVFAQKVLYYKGGKMRGWGMHKTYRLPFSRVVGPWFEPPMMNALEGSCRPRKGFLEDVIRFAPRINKWGIMRPEGNHF